MRIYFLIIQKFFKNVFVHFLQNFGHQIAEQNFQDRERVTVDKVINILFHQFGGILCMLFMLIVDLKNKQ